MNKNLIAALLGVIVPAVMTAVFGYWAWISYTGLVIRAGETYFISGLEKFNMMMVALFLFGFFTGMLVVIVPIVSGVRSEVRKKQEREKLREEIRKEIELEQQKPVANTSEQTL